jgi:hypothetical protein
MVAAQDTLASGLRGFWLVLDGHLGLAQNEPENEGATILLSRRVSSSRPIRILMKYPG